MYIYNLAFINEGRLINRCEVCKRIGMGLPTSFLRDMRKECCHTLCHKWGVCDIGLSFASDGVNGVTDWLR
jgi:hypothetical protein